MNVLLIFPHFNGPEKGSSLRSWQIGRFLAKKGHHVTVFTPAVDLLTGRLIPEAVGRLYADTMTEGVRVIWVRTLQNFRQSALHRLLYEVIYALLVFAKALVIPRADVVVIAQPPAVSPIFGFTLTRLWRVPVVFEVRDLMAQALQANQYVRFRPFQWLATQVEDFLIRRSDRVICVTPGIQRMLEARGVPAGRITLVTNAYEPEVFEETSSFEDLRLRYGWGKRFVVIYAGALTQSYDIATLLKAARRLRHHEHILFVIVGEGERRVEYEDFCRRESLENVQFIGPQPRLGVAALLKAANLGVHLFPDHPFWDLVLGNKTFDYLGSGLPMLYAGRGDTADLIEAAKAGKVVSPGDDQAVAEAILWFGSHPKEAAEMGRSGEQYVKCHYNRHVLLERFETVLREAIH